MGMRSTSRWRLKLWCEFHLSSSPALSSGSASVSGSVSASRSRFVSGRRCCQWHRSFSTSTISSSFCTTTTTTTTSTNRLSSVAALFLMTSPLIQLPPRQTSTPTASSAFLSSSFLSSSASSSSSSGRSSIIITDRASSFISDITSALASQPAPLSSPSPSVSLSSSPSSLSPPSAIGPIAIRINPDLQQRAVMLTSAINWLASPTPGVWRRMLHRQGDEIAVATTVVRFDPNTQFPEHQHGSDDCGGEEFLMLDGVFSDTSGDFPAGTYIRHPIGSIHQPWSMGGCTLLVKLRQILDTTETTSTVIDSLSPTAAWKAVSLEYQSEINYGQEKGSQHAPVGRSNSSNTRKEETRWTSIGGGGGGGGGGGREVLELFHQPLTGEHVWLERWTAETTVQRWVVPTGGEEFYVLAGDLADDEGTYEKGSWVRNPISYGGSVLSRWSSTGCTLWFKSGHLPMLVAAEAKREALASVPPPPTTATTSAVNTPPIAAASD